MSEQKRFEDWKEVDCNDCARYWDSSCDGAPCSQKSCNSYIATRSIVIPKQLNSLEKRTNRLRISIMLNTLLIIAHLLTHIVGWE